MANLTATNLDSAPNQTFKIEDFAGKWKSLNLLEMAKQDLPNLIDEAKEGKFSSLTESLSKQEMAEFKSKPTEKIVEEFLSAPMMAIFENSDPRFLFEFQPPNKMSIGVSIKDQEQTESVEGLQFELRGREIFVRADDQISIFKIVDKDTLKTRNENAGKIPKYLTLKREKE